MRSKQQALVLGIGNAIRGDDGIGPAIVAQLDNDYIDPSVHLIDIGSGCLKLLHYLEEPVGKILIIDCAIMDLKAGDYRIFKYDNLQKFSKYPQCLTHNQSVASVLAIAKRLGYNIPPIRYMGIQPGNLNYTVDLSAELKEKLPDYAGAVRLEIAKDW